VFVNNVRQEAGIAYTVAGTALNMTGNVASTDDFYVIYQGKALQTVVPPDGSVSTAKIASGAVTTAKLDTPIGIETTSSTFKMTDLTSNAFYRTGTFTPTFTNFTVGNGSVFGRYIRIGDMVTCWFGFEFGSTSSVGGVLTAVTGLPFTSVELISGSSNGYFPVDGIIWNNGSGWNSVHGKMNENNTNVIYIQRRADDSDVNATSPITWASGDTLNLTVTYETDDA